MNVPAYICHIIYHNKVHKSTGNLDFHESNGNSYIE